MGFAIQNQIKELDRFKEFYQPTMGYFYIPDTKISESEVKSILNGHTDWGYIYEDVYFNFDGLPEVGVGSFCIGPKKWLDV